VADLIALSLILMVVAGIVGYAVSKLIEFIEDGE
jgi:hypothetical protein